MGWLHRDILEWQRWHERWRKGATTAGALQQCGGAEIKWYNIFLILAAGGWDCSSCPGRSKRSYLQGAKIVAEVLNDLTNLIYRGSNRSSSPEWSKRTYLQGAEIAILVLDDLRDQDVVEIEAVVLNDPTDLTCRGLRSQ